MLDQTSCVNGNIAWRDNEAALGVFDDGDFADLVDRALVAARDRAGSYPGRPLRITLLYLTR